MDGLIIGSGELGRAGCEFGATYAQASSAMGQYNGQTAVPLDQVCRDFFGHLTVKKRLRKALRGDIALPIARIETSQKAHSGSGSSDACRNAAI